MKKIDKKDKIVKKMKGGNSISLNKNSLKNNIFKKEIYSFQNKNIINIVPGVFNFSPNFLKELDLSFNKIQILKANTFIGLNNLKKLYLNDNNLLEIAVGAFHGLNNLEELYLNNNNLEKLKPGSFEGLINLKLLDLKKCAIIKIISPIFLGLENLNSLFLNDNYIIKLEYECFNGLINLEILHLHLIISKMESNYFIGKGLGNLKILHLYGIDSLITKDSLKKILKLHGLKNLEILHIFSYYEDIYIPEEEKKENNNENIFSEIPDNSEFYLTKLNFTNRENKINNKFIFPIHLIETFIDLYVFIKNIKIDLNQLNNNSIDFLIYLNNFMNEFFILNMKNLSILYPRERYYELNETFYDEINKITKYLSNLRNLFSMDDKEIIVFQNNHSSIKYEKKINNYFNNNNNYKFINNHPKLKLILFNQEEYILQNKTFYFFLKESELLNILISANVIHNLNSQISLPNINKENIILIEEIINDSEYFKKTIYKDYIMIRLLYTIQYLKIKKLEKIVFIKIMNDYSINRIKDIFSGLLNPSNLY